MPASEIFLKEKMFSNCSPRAAKIMRSYLCFARGKSNGSSIFSKLANGSSYCGILRFNAMLEKCLLKVIDISSSLSITSFFSILCLRAICLRNKTLQCSKKYLQPSVFDQDCYNSRFQLFMLMISKNFFASYRLLCFQVFYFKKNCA